MSRKHTMFMQQNTKIQWTIH